jgi:protein-disulfide isomerase
MKEEREHETQEQKIIERYSEEGMLTVETLDTASHEATTLSHKKHTRKNFVLTTPIAIIIAGVIIALGIIIYGFITKESSSTSNTTLFMGKQLQADEYIDGKEDSEVIVIEYSDPECPYCVQVSPTIKKLREEYAKRIAFSYRHFPLTQIHPHALDESKAIYCAGTVGGTKKYYEYIDTLYSYKMNKQTTQLPATGKEDFAKAIGIDLPAFTKCMKGNESEKIVIDSINDGVTAGVQGTPSTFVLLKTKKGYEIISMVDGARPYEFFRAVIEEALSR